MRLPRAVLAAGLGAAVALTVGGAVTWNLSGSSAKATDQSVHLVGAQVQGTGLGNVLLSPADAPAVAASTATPTPPPPISGSARDSLTSVLSQLQALGSTGNKDLDKHVSDAKGALTKALSPSLWTGSDGNHVDPKKGNQVFDNVQNAVQDLEAIKSPHPVWVQPDIDQMVGAARLILSVAGGDNLCGGKTDKITAAQRELSNGDTEYGQGHFDGAVSHYKNGWSQANGANGTLCSFPISGSVSGLYPGKSANLPITVTNPNNFDVQISNLTVTVGNASAQCGMANLTPGPSPAAFVVPRNTAVTQSMSVTMTTSAPNQCQGATFPLTYNAQVSE